MSQTNPLMLTPKQLPLKLFIPFIAAIAALTPLAIDTYLPAMLVIADELNTDMRMMQLSLSLYLAGYAAGLFFFGPLADIFGRRPMVLLGLSGFAVCSLLLVFSESAAEFLLLRLLQAFLGSAASIPVFGYIKVAYGEGNLAKGVSYVMMIMMLAPMIAPPIGILLLEVYGWQSIFFMLTSYAVFILLVSIFTLPHSERVPRDDTLFNTFFKSYAIVLNNQPARRYIMTICFTTLAFFGYLTAISFIYMTVYHVSEKTFGVLFAINVGIFMAASFFNARVVSRFGLLKMVKSAWIATLIGAVGLMVVNLQMMHLYWTVIFLGLLIGGVVIIGNNVDTLILLEFPEQTGTASGVIGTIRFGVGAFAGPLLTLFYDGSVFPFCYLMLFAAAGVAVCLFVMPNRSTAVAV